ncbi:MAG TPA: transcriptional regulator, partial [Bacteroidetes bacterium]|nr:transcriptional regulator [Bacteroidota bacterium]
MNSLFKALGDPTRLKILEMLRKNDLTAGEIADAF